MLFFVSNSTLSAMASGSGGTAFSAMLNEALGEGVNYLINLHYSLNDENVYLNILQGFRYIYHYTMGTLPQREMARWSNKPLTMQDVFDFESAKKNGNWEKNGFLGGDDIIIRHFKEGIKVCLQNDNMPISYINAKDNYMIQVFMESKWITANGYEREITKRVGLIDYRAFNISKLIRARNIIYRPY